ncbi:MAG: PDZ domain-containing protein, partial [Planctomycetota bacterium]|jgi:membrane-associated protease RseP (regulator of RpoE activity)
VGTGKEFRPILQEANRSVGLNLSLAERAYPGSDHTPFYGKKIPCLFFMTGIHPEYHKPADTVSTINIGGMVRVTRLLFLTAAKLASMDGRPAFQAQTPARGILGGRRRPRLGFTPDTEFDGTGTRIAEVSPDTPAARAGLRGGGVIVEFAGKPVKNLRDFFRLLSRVKPGAEAKLVFLRNGEKKSTKVRFEK